MNVGEKKMDKVLGAILIAFATILIVAVVLIKIWFWGSLITSSVKSVGGSCGQTYGIEGKLISGNWFCSGVKDAQK